MEPRGWKEVTMGKGEWKEVSQRPSRRPTDKQLRTLEERLGYNFKRTDLLFDALTHSSYSGTSNDLLGTLGMKTVEQAAALYMLMENPQITKGELADFITKNSNAKECAKDAATLGLESFVMVARGVIINCKILSTAFNAILGAITIDDGPTTANFVYWKVKQWRGHVNDF